MKKITLFFCLVLAAAACNKADIKEDNGVGVLNMKMNIEVPTKASLSPDELLNTASVKIYKANFKGLVRSYVYSEMPSPFYLAADTYRVDVEAGEAVKENPSLASWEQKSYKGSKEFAIRNGQVTDVEVEAFVNNAVTCIAFDQTVADNFAAGYTFTIGLDADSQLVYDASKSGSEGYFIVDGIKEPSFNWTFTGTLLKDGSTFTRTGTIDDKMNLKYTIKDGDIEFSLMVDYTADVVDDTIVFDPVMTGLLPSSAFEIWAGHAVVHANVDAKENAGATIQFGYSSNGTDWSYSDAVMDEDGSYHASLTGLTPSTDYTYKLVVNGVDAGDSRTFTTESAPSLPNASFEYVSLVSGQKFYKFYDPDCGVADGEFMFWGSGNGEGSEGVNGSANLGIVITYVDTEDKVDGKQSVRAQTSQLAGMLAAGNLFTGQFAGLVGTSGGKVNFGRPWTSRPSALKLYCKYSTGTIDIINSTPPGVTLTKSDYDRAQIKIALGTWDYKKYGGTLESPVHINTTDASTFVDFTTDPSTVADGNLIIHHDGYYLNGGDKVAAETGEWIEYVIPLNYHSMDVQPTHIIVSCASSQFGDYFTGCSSSRLWIDAVELLY